MNVERSGDQKKAGIPVGLIVLDLIGTVLMALGAAEMFANTNLVPAAWQFENYALAMILFGLFIALPLMLHLVKRSAGQRR